MMADVYLSTERLRFITIRMVRGYFGSRSAFFTADSPWFFTIDIASGSRYVPTAYTFTNPHLTRTPHPANVIPLHNLGNILPVAGSVTGAIMTGSPPNEPAEHCTCFENFDSFDSYLAVLLELNILLLAPVVVVVHSNVAVAATRREIDEIDEAPPVALLVALVALALEKIGLEITFARPTSNRLIRDTGISALLVEAGEQ
mmetsp:Transcript_14509/g.21976  ORF Transcript_14509/g.21976 Transcript_14509/m.21976 type:complete len:201 (-) Transcript_14509:173-775(-)